MAAGSTHGGKGSSPRPIKDQQKFSDNWDLIFGKKEPIPEPKSEETDDSEL